MKSVTIIHFAINWNSLEFKIITLLWIIYGEHFYELMGRGIQIQVYWAMMLLTRTNKLTSKIAYVYIESKKKKKKNNK